VDWDYGTFPAVGWQATDMSEFDIDHGTVPGQAPISGGRAEISGLAVGTVGIDIESTDNLPWSGDPWTEPFYVDNFTGPEIAYCVRQPNPRLSLCGLWSAKEAAKKCGHEFARLRPVDIEIQPDEQGRPTVRAVTAGDAACEPNCVLSISHSGTTCVAVCVRGAGRGGTNGAGPQPAPVIGGG
jgi:phosphopantetheine--protein transferase-like protein